jgi:hypothetical protein
VCEREGTKEKKKIKKWEEEREFDYWFPRELSDYMKN